MLAESVDVAEHSSTFQRAMGGGLSTGLTRSLRAALHDAPIRLLNTDEKPRDNRCVIRQALQPDPRQLELRDRSCLDTPRTITRNGVSDRQEMA